MNIETNTMTENKNETTTVKKSLTVSYSIKPLKKRRIILTFLSYFFLSISLASAIFYFSYQWIGTFPDYIPISNANELLNILISVNGILLGFVGIIFAQLLSSIMDQQNVLFQRILEKPKESSSRFEALRFLDIRRYALSLIAVSTFVSLSLSILTSFVNIAKNSQFKPADTLASFGLFFFPLLFTVVAVVLLALSLTALPMRPPLEKEQV